MIRKNDGEYQKRKCTSDICGIRPKPVYKKSRILPDIRTDTGAGQGSGKSNPAINGGKSPSDLKPAKAKDGTASTDEVSTIGLQRPEQ